MTRWYCKLENLDAINLEFLADFTLRESHKMRSVLSSSLQLDMW